MRKFILFLVLVFVCHSFGQTIQQRHLSIIKKRVAAAPAGCDLVDENFDGASNGDDLCTLSDWYRTCADTREVSTTQAVSGANSLYLDLGGDANNNAHGLGGQSSGDFLVSFNLYLVALANGQSAYFLAIPDSNNSDHGQLLCRAYRNGSTYYLQYVNSGGSGATITTINLDTWYLVEGLADMDNDDQSWKVDNTPYVTDAALPYGNSGESATHVELSSNCTGLGTLYIDDLCIDTDTSAY